MAFIKLQFRPGINRDTTNYSNEGGWWDCDKVRFRSGFPEKIGGWVKSTINPYVGVVRQMWTWVSSYSDNFLALGTNQKVYIEVGGDLYDITPVRNTFSSTDTDNCFATTDGSTDIVVTIADHEANDGDYVIFSGAADVGGVPAAELNAEHIVQLINTDTFIISVATPATSTVSAGGGTSIEATFLIEPGNPDTTLGYGWGTGTWGRGAWGSGSSSPVNLPQRDWWFDNFDNDLIMNIRDGAPYYWERGANALPNVALSTRAVPLQDIATAAGYNADDVPVRVGQLLVSQNDKHLLAFGAVPFGSTLATEFDPLLIRWASQDEPGRWRPEPTNSAGFIRVSRGSKIVRALPTRQEILVWTDSHLYTLQFLGTTDVFGVQEYADSISIASPRAVATAANATFWMGRDKFYVYTGRVDTLPCTVRNYVFADIDFTQSDQIVCGANEEWSEIWWFYPSASSGENWNDRYVVYNYQEKIWYYGSMQRTAWLDAPTREFPIAAGSGRSDSVGYIYEHENGVDDDSNPMASYIQSSDFDLADGDKFMLVRRLIPDLQFVGSTGGQGGNTPHVDFEIRTRSFPGSVLMAEEADSQGVQVVQTQLTNYTEQVFIRARARQMALRVESDALGVQWQLGSPRLDGRPDGTR